MLARKIDKAWEPFDGTAEFQKMVTAADLHRLDGSVETIEVAPYPLTVTLSATAAIESWSAEELAEYGLAKVVPFDLPEGMVAVGDLRLVERDGQVFAEFDTETAPPPPAARSAEEKVARMLADYDLTPADLAKALIKADQVVEAEDAAIKKG